MKPTKVGPNEYPASRFIWEAGLVIAACLALALLGALIASGVS